MSEPIVTQCPGCKQKYKVSTDSVGKQVKCQKCGACFSVCDGQAPPPAVISGNSVADDQWYVAIGKESKGPFTTAQIISFVQGKKLKLDTFVRTAGMVEWKAIASLRQFAQLTGAVSMDADRELPAAIEVSAKDGPSNDNNQTSDGKVSSIKRKGLFGGLKDALANAAAKCPICGTRLTISEHGANMGKCAKCALVETGMVANASDGFIFSQSATYLGGLPNEPQPGKQNGFIFLLASGLNFFYKRVRWHVPFQHILSADLDTFQISGARALEI